MRLLLLAGVLALCAPCAASSQSYDYEYDYDESDEEYRDIPCPSGLNTYFPGNYRGVYHAGKEWRSEWRAISSIRPLPSRTWYYAYPNRHVISTDRTTSWEYAEVRVHCWRYRAMYLTVIHYDPIEYRGYVKPIPPQSGTGGGGDGGCGGYPDPDYMTSIAPADPEYGVFADDYDPYYPDCGGSGGGSGGSGSGGGGGGGDWGGMTFPEMCSSLGGKLYYDFYCLELWNDKTGNYETVWCGTGATCET